MAAGKCFAKSIFDINMEINIFEISNVLNFNEFWAFFNFGTNLGLTGGKYLIKIIFDIKIEIGIFKISNVPNVNKFWAFLIFELIWG